MSLQSKMYQYYNTHRWILISNDSSRPADRQLLSGIRCSPEFYKSWISPFAIIAVYESMKDRPIYRDYVKFFKFAVSCGSLLQLIICSYQFRFQNSREASIRKQINFFKFVWRTCQQIFIPSMFVIILRSVSLLRIRSRTSFNIIF